MLAPMDFFMVTFPPALRAGLCPLPVGSRRTSRRAPLILHPDAVADAGWYSIARSRASCLPTRRPAGVGDTRMRADRGRLEERTFRDTPSCPHPHCLTACAVET